MFADIITQSSHGILNGDQPTRSPSNGPETSPDISLATPDILIPAEWSTQNALGSDHLPIIISLPNANNSPLQAPKRTFINLVKADWDKFQLQTESQFADIPLPTDVRSGEKTFRNIILASSKQHIPAGRYPQFRPNIPEDASRLMKQRDETRKNNPTSPELHQLNTAIENKISNHIKKKWHETVEKVNAHSNLTALWSTIRRLSKGPQPESNRPIRFKGKPVTNTKNIATNFNLQFSSVTQKSSNKRTRVISNKIKSLPLSQHAFVCPEQVQKAISKSRPSKAFGPDNITMIHLKHLGPHGIQFLTQLFNLSVQNSIIPDIWKQSTIIPLAKPGKDPSEGKSYRPVSLISPLVKVLERLLLPYLNEHLLPAQSQHGFRPRHSTITALHQLHDSIASGFNQKKPAHRTVVVALDLSKAFDMVDHNTLLADVLQSSLPNNIIRWLSTYLRGRQSKVLFRDTLSKSCQVRTGVPQGSVISPTLFNYYVSQMPQPPEGLKLISYADDTTVSGTGPSTPVICDKLNNYLPELLDFLDQRKLQVSPEKSSVTLFTPWTKEANTHPQVFIGDSLIPLVKHPKILGVTFDTMFSFSPQYQATLNGARGRNNVLKALSGSNWGADKETLTLSYKAITRSKLEYGSAIWGPGLSETGWSKLQIIQNEGLRIATGCHKMADTTHLHQETKVLPLRDHAQMLNQQYMVSCYHPQHPNHHLTHSQNPPRLMKNTLTTGFPSTISQRLANMEVDDTCRKNSRPTSTNQQ